MNSTHAVVAVLCVELATTSELSYEFREVVARMSRGEELPHGEFSIDTDVELLVAEGASHYLAGRRGVPNYDELWRWIHNVLPHCSTETLRRIGNGISKGGVA